MIRFLAQDKGGKDEILPTSFSISFLERNNLAFVISFLSDTSLTVGKL